MEVSETCNFAAISLFASPSRMLWRTWCCRSLKDRTLCSNSFLSLESAIKETHDSLVQPRSPLAGKKIFCPSRRRSLRTSSRSGVSGQGSALPKKVMCLVRGTIWASTLFVGLGLLVSKALGQTGSVNNQRVSLAMVDFGDRPATGSTYVPMDSWI
jgi:hypothetical protein